MTVKDVAEILNGETLTGSDEAIMNAVTGCYCGDLLSWVMGKASPGDVWVTIMSNINVAAVAGLTEAACVVLAEGVMPDENLRKRAVREDLVIIKTELSAYEVCCKLYGKIAP